MLSYIVEVIGNCAERTLSDETTFRNLSLSVSLINHGWLECLLQGFQGDYYRYENIIFLRIFIDFPNKIFEH